MSGTSQYLAIVAGEQTGVNQLLGVKTTAQNHSQSPFSIDYEADQLSGVDTFNQIQFETDYTVCTAYIWKTSPTTSPSIASTIKCESHTKRCLNSVLFSPDSTILGMVMEDDHGYIGVSACYVQLFSVQSSQLITDLDMDMDGGQNGRTQGACRSIDNKLLAISRFNDATVWKISDNSTDKEQLFITSQSMRALFMDNVGEGFYFSMKSPVAFSSDSSLLLYIRKQIIEI